MAVTKFIHDKIRDNGLSYFQTVAAAGNLRLILNSAAPATPTEARTLYDGTAGKYRLSNEITVASADVTLSNNPGGGRRITVASKTGTAAATRAAGELCFSLVNAAAGAEELLYVGEETTDQAITSGNTITFPAFDIIIPGTVN